MNFFNFLIKIKMKESFDEYKGIIESNIMTFSYLYSGDVIHGDSVMYTGTSLLHHNKVSPSFIIDTIVHIYEKSIKLMMSKSIEIIKIIDFDKIDNNGNWFDNILNYIDDENLNIKYLFTNEENKSKLGITRAINEKPFPDYFYHIKNMKFGAKLYKTPLVLNSDCDIIVFMTDRPIQSLVYSIQNMSYSINGNKHTLNYKFYECDYLSYKLIIRDIKKVRDDKINFILDY